MPERIMERELLTNGHLARYHLATGFLEPRDVVIDAACGIGYGADLLQNVQDVHYVGIDKDLSGLSSIAWNGLDRIFLKEDLETWEPGAPFDVAVSFETIEHLNDWHTLVNWMCLAKKWIVASVPVVPTVGINPYHKHDFSPGELPDFFDGWELFQVFQQPSEVSEVYVMQREE